MSSACLIGNPQSIVQMVLFSCHSIRDIRTSKAKILAQVGNYVTDFPQDITSVVLWTFYKWPMF